MERARKEKEPDSPLRRSISREEQLQRISIQNRMKKITNFSNWSLQRWVSAGDKWLYKWNLCMEKTEIDFYAGYPFDERMDVIELIVQMEKLLNNNFPHWPDEIDSDMIINVHQELEREVMREHINYVDDLCGLAFKFDELLKQIKKLMK